MWSSGIPGVRGTIPGNSQRGVVGYQFPRRRQRRSWRPGITPGAGVGVVLETWCYTRAAGTEVIHVAATGFQGIPDCVARYKFPRIWRRLNQYQRLLGASIPMGSVIYTRVAWVTASDWNTGAQSSHGVINLHFVYALSLFSLFILCHCLVCLYRHVDLLVYNKVTLVAPMPTRR